MNRRWTYGVSSAVAMVLALAAASAQAETVKLKLAFLSSDRQQSYVAVLKPFIDAVNAEGKGIVEIVPYPGGVLSHDAAEQVMLLKNGVADMAWVVPGVTPNVFPDNGLFELPGLFDNTGEATRAYSKILATQTLQGYQGFVVLGALASEPETIHTKAPVKTLGDLKGLRISTNNSQSEMTFKALGIVPVELALPAAAEAIGKGQIDGSASPMVPVVDFGISKVATYHYLLHTSVTPLLLLINRPTFDALPKAAQDILVKFSGNWVEQRYIEMNTAAGEAVLQQLRANPARTVTVPSPVDQATARAAFAKVADQWQARDPRYPGLLAAARSEVMSLRGAAR